MATVKITRAVKLPDPVKLARYEKSPRLGPRILFFSGGTALRDLSAQLIQYTHNSIHLITPFDSGGSSASLREAFQMPAIGDIRNRLMALADKGLHGHGEIYALFASRFPRKARLGRLRDELESMAQGRHRLVSKIPDPLRKIIRRHLQIFLESMPPGFDLRGASIGNLVLTAGYLDSRRHLDPVIFIFSKLVQVRGTVRPIINKPLHLRCCLEDGRVIVGQHLLTGKEGTPIKSGVKSIHLTLDLQDQGEAEVTIRNKTKELIQEAELICYPMGSFYSSIIANFLPRGVGKAISQNPCPKIFIPNTTKDPETLGLSLQGQLERLLTYLRRDNPEGIGNQDVLNFVLLDKKHGRYAGTIGRKEMARLGLEVIDSPLIAPQDAPFISAARLLPLLLSLT
jgi:CofD-related protein of GAK system